MTSMRDPPFGDVLCTVLDHAGSTYGKPGLRVRIHADGSMDGMLNGGCFDADLIEQAAAVRADGRPRVLLYDAREPADDIYGSGSGCRGGITVLMEPVPAPTSPFARWLDSLFLERPGPGLAVTAISGNLLHGERVGVERLLLVSPSGVDLMPPSAATTHPAMVGEACSSTAVARLLRTVEGQSVFVERAPVPLRLLVVGGGRDAEPVVALAATLGWRTVVLDHRPARVNARLFPGAEGVQLARPPHRPSSSTAVASSARKTVVEAGADAGGVLIDNTSTAFDAALIMTHNLALDTDALAWLAAGDIPFIGLLGPSARRDRILAEIGAEIGAGAGRLAGRLFAPVGIHLGGTTPEAIALSIVAQVQAHGAGAAGGPLSTQTLATSSLVQAAGNSASA
jgi:xanthine dehydrogenase accessory factor